MPEHKKHILIILDGYGIAEDPSVSAIDHAKKPYLDSLFRDYPHATLKASGSVVGLPPGQMGNSEVGHMNLGAGCTVYQDITLIDRAINDGSFSANTVFVQMCEAVLARQSQLHLVGLLSDGGVHSHLDHVKAILGVAAENGLGQDQVHLHAFLDGRDTDPHGGLGYCSDILQCMEETNMGQLSSVVGRYWAMDRDRRWERTKMAFDLLVHGDGASYTDVKRALSDSYSGGTTDEFVTPVALIHNGGVADSRIKAGDIVLFFNFRADRARQLTRALIEPEFPEFDRGQFEAVQLISLTTYDEAFDIPVVFPDIELHNTIGEVIEQVGGTQLRAAETEKYPHVTYFFSGGREEPFRGEDRILIPSPKVATYDLQPEMSAPELAQKVAEAITDKDYTLVVLNFANPDMVGHTGDFQAAVEAVEAADAATETVVTAALDAGYSINIISDHGNADRMINPDGSPYTAHTTALVPHIVIVDDFAGPVADGKLGDIAPTILTILGIAIPTEMTGSVLISRETDV